MLITSSTKQSRTENNLKKTNIFIFEEYNLHINYYKKISLYKKDNKKHRKY